MVSDPSKPDFKNQRNCKWIALPPSSCVNRCLRRTERSFQPPVFHFSSSAQTAVLQREGEAIPPMLLDQVRGTIRDVAGVSL